eukprot:NODE_1987_length_1728_cov_62.198754_g1695_i0.p1 GENE.NODE_1987_length_1728_cov_62.198754_g1695_i0~~NODE_1987_length_1728_cov_62.198754_g1695_i0.p1  ORF type:complete len:525 (-),score=91.86 NODE_1987_length_1728_cov_62.198754_g1695_i0:66-1640(-)
MRDKVVSLSWLFRVLFICGIFFVVSHLLSYSSLKSTLQTQKQALTTLDHQVFQLHKETTELTKKISELPRLISQIKSSIKTENEQQTPKTIESGNEVTTSEKTTNPPDQKWDDVPYHLLADQSTKPPDLYHRTKSLPEVIAGMEWSEITRLTGWTKPMLIQQLKLLLQCQGQPAQLPNWHRKFMAQYEFNGHSKKADLKDSDAEKLMKTQRCKEKGANPPWTREDLLNNFAEFIKIYTDYSQRPFEFNPWGQRLTHSFGTWFHVKRMQPKYIIESGVYWGHTTWLMRKAAPNATIICMDPGIHQIRHWDKDAIYITGPEKVQKMPYMTAREIRPFKDFTQVDWSFISEEDRKSNTIILFDDHQDEWNRVKQMHELGFRKAMFDDNWFVHQGDNFSIKQLCDETGGTVFPSAPQDKVLRTSNFSMNNVWRPLSDHQADRKKFLELTKFYFEMPPVLWYPPLILHSQFRVYPHKDVPSNPSLVYITAGTIDHPLIRTQEEFDRFDMKSLPLREFWYYMNHCYLELN